MATGEEQEYSTIDDDGTTRTPPNKQNVTSTNLVSGDTVTCHRLTGAGGDIDIEEFTMNANNDRGDTTIEVTTTISASHPNVAGSKVRVQSNDGTYHRYRYSTFQASPDQFNLMAASTGTADAGSTNTVLDETSPAATFQTDGVEVGDYVRHTASPFQFSIVTGVPSETRLNVTDNGTSWSALPFSVNTLVEDYESGDFVFVPLIERIADAASESSTLTMVNDASPIFVRLMESPADW